MTDQTSITYQAKPPCKSPRRVHPTYALRCGTCPACQARSEIERAHARLTQADVPICDDHGKPLGLALRIAVLADSRLASDDQDAR